MRRQITLYKHERTDRIMHDRDEDMDDDEEDFPEVDVDELEDMLNDLEM